MGKHKLSRLHSAPTLGLSVTAVCSSTGLPAVTTPAGTQKIGKNEFPLLVPGQDEQESERNRLISRETTFKLAARDLANERLKYTIGEVAKWYDFPSDIDNLGRISGEESYVAVVHADGNKMGDHVKDDVVKKVEDKYGKEENKVKFNREYILASREFSRKIEKASRKTLVHIVEKIVASIDSDGMVAGRIPVVTVNTKTRKYNYIPFRPLVFGGDDVTFLCNGQLGVELATQYLKAFEIFSAEEGLNFHACAGVSIVKMHYPFSRAYKLSEELIKSAKKFVKEKVKEDKSAVDWHFAQSGLSGSLDVIRDREYSYTKENTKGEKIKYHLGLRPLVLRDQVQSWQSIEYIMSELQDEKPWSESHNKVVGLREPLRNGAKAVEQYRLNYDLPPLPDIAGDKAAQSGWLGTHCIYFDAIELLDHHVSLKMKAEDKNVSK